MQRAEVKGEGHVVHEYRSLEDVRVFLLERPRRHTRARAVCQPSCPGYSCLGLVFTRPPLVGFAGDRLMAPD